MQKKICSRCNKVFSTRYDHINACKECRNSYEYILEKNYERYNDTNEDEWIECKICKLRYKTLNVHLKDVHKTTAAEYKKLYNVDTITSKNSSKNFSEKISGDKNPGWKHGGKFSPFSKNFIKYENEEDAEEKIKIVCKKMSESQKNGGSVRRKEYWLKKGYSEEEAKLKLSEAQRTFSKDKCIEKYGEEEGIKIWQDRQNKWQNTLNSKSNEEKLMMNRKKVISKDKCIERYGEEEGLIRWVDILKKRTWKLGATSVSEKELLNLIRDEGVDVKAHLYMKTRDNSNCYFFDIYIGNKIIEYNGDYWHANPENYSKDDLIRFPGAAPKLVEDVWKRDSKKIDEAISNGFEVLVIWEKDFKKDKTAMVQKCLNFIES